MHKYILLLLVPFLSLFADAISDTFPSPANTLSEGTITLNNPSQANGSPSGTLVSKNLWDNGGSCDGGTCSISNTSAASYAFTPDLGSGSVPGITAGATYTTDQEFNNITLNTNVSITFKGDLTVKAQWGITSDGTINIDGNVVLHTTTLTQNTNASINIISGSLTIYAAGEVIFNTASTITPTQILCFSQTNIKFNEGVHLQGLFYADTQVIVNKDVIIEGAVTSTDLILNENAIINYGGVSATPIPVTNIAEYRFDECSAGEWKKDHSSYENSATGTPEIITNDGKDYMATAIRNANYDVKAAHIPAYEINSGTVSLLVYDHHSVSDLRLISKGWSSTNQLYMGVKPTSDADHGTFYVTLNENTIDTGETYFDTIGSGDLDTQWIHVVFTFGSNGMKLYINGVLKGSNAYTGGMSSNTSDFSFPAISGYFDEFYLFDGQMDDTEIQSLYNNIINNKNIDGTQRVCSNQMISGTIYNSATAALIANAKILLYKDDGNGLPDAADTFVESNTTNASGYYSFGVLDGSYFVTVDSTTLDTDTSIWLEQSHGPAGSFCADGNGSYFVRSVKGECMGGKLGGVDDDASTLASAEHVALVSVPSTDANETSFYFSPDLVTNANDSGQGSFRQFLTNANGISGANSMVFIPSVPKNESLWWSVTLTSPLPEIIDSPLTIDGRAYYFDKTLRNANSVASGSGGASLGTGSDGVAGSGDEPTLDSFDGKEFEININQVDSYGIKVHKAGITDINISNIAIFGALETNTTEERADISVIEDASNIDIGNNYVGLRADSSIPFTPSGAHGILLLEENTGTITNFAIHHNLVGYTGEMGIFTAGNGISTGDIYQNEVFHSDYTGKWFSDGISVEVGSQDIDIYENYSHHNNGPGFDSWQSAGNIRWRNNTAHDNGKNIDSNPNSVETFGLRSMGNDNVIQFNHIYSSGGAGVVVGMYEETATNTLRSHISQNSIYDNNATSIDLDQTDGNGTNPMGDGMTANNGTINNTLQNNDMDTPIFTKATLDTTLLHVEGYVGSAAGQSTFGGSTIEVYKVEDDGDGYGEGKWYVGSITADADGNFNTDINISSLPITLMLGDFISATATDSTLNTSEFGPNQLIEAPNTFTCSEDAYIFASDDYDKPTDSYEVDIAGNQYRNGKTSMHDYNINAIGYNVKDNYIWGYDRFNKTVVRVDNEYNVSPVAISGLPAGDYFIGDVSTDGFYYLVSDSTMYKINLATATVDQTINLSEKLDSADMAFNPVDGNIYYINSEGHIKRIDPNSGATVDIGQTDMFTKGMSHTAFFDANGNMYAYNSANQYIYRIGVPSSHTASIIPTEYFAYINIGRNGDGARCVNAPMGDSNLTLVPDFNIIDAGLGYTEDGNITTKIVGEGFSLSVMAKDVNTSIPLKDVNITQLDLYDCNMNVIQQPWWTGVETTNSEGFAEITDLNVTQAYRCLRIRAYGVYDTYSNDGYSIDEFAVRPLQFAIMPHAATYIAGMDFTLDVEAADIVGNPAVLYNEKEGISFRIDATELNSSCNPGDLNVTDANFTNGLMSHPLTDFNNVGTVNIRVYEINGSEFANVDVNDTPDTQRYIAEADSDYTFIPNNFYVDWNITNQHTNPDFTYFSNDPADAASSITLQAKSYSAESKITNNYKGECASNDVNMTVSFSTVGNGGTYLLKWNDGGTVDYTKEITAGNSGTFSYIVPKADFYSGEMNKTLLLNFQRESNRPMEPLEMSINKIELKDMVNTGVAGDLVKDENVTYYYGRLHAPTYSSVGADFNATLNYELYCKSCNPDLFPLVKSVESADSIYWYVLKKAETNGFNGIGCVNDTQVLNTDNETFIALRSPELPYRDKISYTPKPWLHFNAFLTTLPTHDFTVYFSAKSNTWAGKGEEGRHLDINSSQRFNQKLDW